MNMSHQMSLANFIRYLSTLSSYSKLMEHHGHPEDDGDPLVRYFGNIRRNEVIVNWPIALLLGSF
jgi:hypothetical protein